MAKIPGDFGRCVSDAAARQRRRMLTPVLALVAILAVVEFIAAKGRKGAFER